VSKQEILDNLERLERPLKRSDLKPVQGVLPAITREGEKEENFDTGTEQNAREREKKGGANYLVPVSDGVEIKIKLRSKNTKDTYRKHKRKWTLRAGQMRTPSS